jgi:hypothetical protein
MAAAAAAAAAAAGAARGAAAAAAAAAAAPPPRPFWEDPSALAANRRAAHAPLRSFPSADAAVRYYARPPPLADGELYAPCPRVARLGGRPWRFRVFPSPADAPGGFWEPGFDDSAFGEARGG